MHLGDAKLVNDANKFLAVRRKKKKTAAMEDRIIAELNAELGSKVDNLARSQGLVDKYVEQLNSIEQKVRNCELSFLFTSIYNFS